MLMVEAEEVPCAEAETPRAQSAAVVPLILQVSVTASIMSEVEVV